MTCPISVIGINAFKQYQRGRT